jgi:hypothetical protein
VEPRGREELIRVLRYERGRNHEDEKNSSEFFDIRGGVTHIVFQKVSEKLDKIRFSAEQNFLIDPYHHF